MLGEALKGRRSSVIVATKVRGKMGDAPEQSGLSRAAIFLAVEESLRRLQTDYIDLYYFHQPDYSTPIEESLEAMQALVQQGKVRYPATSNYASWQVAQMLGLAEEHGCRPVSVAQQMYNLLARGIEQEFLPMAKQMGVSVVAYNPLAAGLLTGKHTRESIAPGTRFDKNKMYQDRYWHPQDFDAVDRLKQVAAAEHRSLVSVALNWMLHHTAIDSVILGASRLEQLDQNLAVAEEGPLSQAAIEQCDDIWRDLRGPTPQYNR
jgi:aryl-alcohol dehydrogenase-like predicted oxidoreductase